MLGKQHHVFLSFLLKGCFSSWNQSEGLTRLGSLSSPSCFTHAPEWRQTQFPWWERSIMNVWGSQCGVSKDWRCFHKPGWWVLRVCIQKLERFAELQGSSGKLSGDSVNSVPWPHTELDVGASTSQWHRRSLHGVPTSLSQRTYFLFPFPCFSILLYLLAETLPWWFKDLFGNEWSQSFLFLNLPFRVRLPGGPACNSGKQACPPGASTWRDTAGKPLC